MAIPGSFTQRGSSAWKSALVLARSKAMANEQLAGILLVAAATLFFTTCDVAAKFLTAHLPALEVVWARYAAFVLFIGFPLVLRGGRATLTTRNPRLQILRAGCLVGSTSLFILGLSALPIADATAISFASPLFITVLSVPLLGERVGVRRLGAVMVGMIGVLLVVQPGTGAFQIAALFPLGSALCWATGMILTRRIAAAGDSTATTLAWTAICGVIVSGALMSFHWATPTLTEIAWVALMGVAFSAGHSLVALAYRLAAASAIAPFSYLQIINATFVGYLVFGNVPNDVALLGAGVISASGLYIASRTRRRADRGGAPATGGENAPVTPRRAVTP